MWMAGRKVRFVLFGCLYSIDVCMVFFMCAYVLFCIIGEAFPNRSHTVHVYACMNRRYQHTLKTENFCTPSIFLNWDSHFHTSSPRSREFQIISFTKPLKSITFFPQTNDDTCSCQQKYQHKCVTHLRLVSVSQRTNISATHKHTMHSLKKNHLLKNNIFWSMKQSTSTSSWRLRSSDWSKRPTRSLTTSPRSGFTCV